MIRGVGLRSAVAINVATMVGAGPFITLPLVVTALHGSVSAAAWVLGAAIALCDGLVWAELASRYPRSGGTYTYLREAFGPRGPGRFVAFLFVWQFLFWAPLILASGYIGFAQYAAYLAPALGAPLPTHLTAVAVGVVTLLALYRAIPQIARAALVLGAVALVTLLAVAFAGLTHPYAPLAETIPLTFNFSVGIVALGSALVITLYDYGGYGDVCALGDEVIEPARTIPRAVVLSVLFVGAAYMLLNLGVAVALPANQIASSRAIASLVAEHAFGAPFAIAITLAVLVTAFGSTYGLLLGASRIPYAAAREGDFLAPFARLHASGKFPAVSLVAIGLLALPASLLPLDAVINALTAGIVLVQGVGQIVALGLARRARPQAPFRVPLYPLPPLIALAGWLYLFVLTGAAAIAFGLITLAAGAVVFLVRARIARSWPFAAATIASVLALVCITPPAGAAPAAPTFGHAAIVRDAAGEPVLRVEGKPFFFLGGAFFYERIPRSAWRASMEAMRAIGANTLDIYVPWNWHEVSDGDFDFDGRTSSRRDLREVLRLGKKLGFYFTVRPGPVIRNEWRNGGYPAWLLQRPEYRMELHDVLEGRYPATATLQNKQSDAAAAEWLGNATHTRYAARWLRRALEEFRPVADRVIAVQLDDDQAAYLDNDTYPAPHLHAYLQWLEAQVRDVVGPVTPTFINTFESKVPSALPEWAMGNWYQSDAYAIGEHDRAELAFATATLRTQNRGPLAYSEFQAGWLAGPADPMPRAADPSNTVLALGALAGWGIKGLIVFPLQDTLAPFGWEAPFSNALYAWDAALRTDGRPGDRFGATARLVRALAFYGPALAEAHRAADVALLYDGRADAYAATARLKASLAACRAAAITCEAIDPLSVSAARLASFRAVVVPAGTYPVLAARLGRLHVPAIPSVAVFSGRKRAAGVTVLRSAHGTFVVVENWSNSEVRYDARSLGLAADAIAPFFLAPRDARIVAVGADLAFLSARYSPGDSMTSSCPVTAKTGDEGVRLGVDLEDSVLLHAFRERPMCAIAARFSDRIRRWNLSSVQALAPAPDAQPAERLVTIGSTHPPQIPFLHLAPNAQIRNEQVYEVWPQGIDAYRADFFEDGEQDIVLQNDRVIAIATPAGGGRVVAFGAYRARSAGPPTFLSTIFDGTGALRDDVALQPPPSLTDRIAKYTHDYPAGTFNRAYAACTFRGARGAGAYLVYDAPDVVPAGGRFEKLIMLAARDDRLIVDERFTPNGPASAQRAVSLSAIAAFRPSTEREGYVIAGTDHLPIGKQGEIDPRSGGATLESAAAGDTHVSVAWRPDDVSAASWAPAQSNGTIRLTFAPGGWRRVTYAFRYGTNAGAARGFGEAERAWVAANRPPSGENGEVAKWYTQSPQKRPSESSCGFESHLPQ